MAQLYVFAPLGTEQRLAGYLKWDDGACRFSYAAAWLGDTRAYALDPRNLPMRTGVFNHVGGSMHGVFADAAPDSWGQSLARMLNQARPTPMELLSCANGGAVGGLTFGLGPEDVDAGIEVAGIDRLPQIEHAAWLISSRKSVSRSELSLAYAHGRYMGGARPKALVVRDETQWIAKFSRADDELDNARNEWACMQVARLAGVDTPRTEIVEVNGRSVLLVERFDRPAGRKVHYLSLRSLLSMDRVASADFIAPEGSCTYGGLAQRCIALGVEGAGEELFRRMLVNLAVGNGDDHLRNHGLLCYDGRWVLAPAFDITSTGGIVQSVGIGVQGRMASLSNALSDLERFGLSALDAEVILAQVRNAAAAMPAMLKLAEAVPADIQRVLGRMRPV